MRNAFSCAALLSIALASAAPDLARAQAQPPKQGFQLNRYEPTPVGEWSFAVDHPWYSSQRYFAAGITLNYAHQPLVIGQISDDGTYTTQTALIGHQLLGHVDLAGSLFDRILISVSLPITVYETGDSDTASRYGVSLVSTAAAGDPRLGLMFRIYGDPYKSAFSLSLGGYVWAPINLGNAFPSHVGDQGVRFMPKIVLGGLSHRVLWSFTAAFYYRVDSVLGTLPAGPGNSVGAGIQFGAAIAYADAARRFSIGPEAVVHTDALEGKSFLVQHTNLEALLGFHYNIARVFQIGVAGGVGVLRGAGTPDGRALLRLAYAPIRKEPPADRDHDGIVDGEDACPAVPGERSPLAERNGCPPQTIEPAPLDRDKDGVLDDDDRCPGEPAGPNPDAAQPGCPLRDYDKDGVFDNRDQCPGDPAGAQPDPARPGCPLRDSDGDGVFDSEDQCVTVAAGSHPSPTKKGCPDPDSDQDEVFDSEDQCPTVSSGLNPDPQKRGCPLLDRDRDRVPDAIDACPDQPGAFSPNPKANGCPGLVEVKEDLIQINQQVFFATNKAEVLKKSFPLLDAVAYTLTSLPAIKKLRVEGHTDDKGKPERNTELSEQRAKSVMQYLLGKGVAAERLQAKGYGPSQPIADNKSGAGRAKNRRVDFKILDPQTTRGEVGVGVSAPAPSPLAPTVTPDAEAATAKGKGKSKKPGKERKPRKR